MSSKKITDLSGNLIVRKGEAEPATSQDNENASYDANQSGIVSRKKSGTIAVTLRLDPERYEQLKLHGAYNRLTNQDIIVSALDAYFRKHLKQ